MMLGIQLRGKKYDKHYPQARRLSPTKGQGCKPVDGGIFLRWTEVQLPLLKQGAPSERHPGPP
jgi:hypothetical protein